MADEFDPQPPRAIAVNPEQQPAKQEPAPPAKAAPNAAQLSIIGLVVMNIGTIIGYNLPAEHVTSFLGGLVTVVLAVIGIVAANKKKSA